MGLGLGFEIGLEDDDDVELVRKQLVPHGHLINSGLDIINDLGLFEIFIRDAIIVEFVTILSVGSPFLLGSLVGKVHSGVIAQFADQV